MSEFNLVYKWKKPEGYYGLKCRIIGHGQADRVWLLFEDGRKLMRSKYAVVGEAKWISRQNESAGAVKVCPTCGQKVKVKRQEEIEW